MFARRGFYEMFAVCVINIVIISIITAFVKKNSKGKVPLAVKLLSLFVSLFSVLLIVVAMVKMKLNIDTYGFTRNRLLVSVFMVMMFIILVFFIIRIFVPNVRYMQAIIIICSLIFVAMSFANIDKFTYEYNLKAFQNNTIDEYDIDNVLSLQPSEEYLVRIIKDGEMKEEAQKYLLSEIKYTPDKYMLDFNNYELTLEKTDIRAYCFEKEKAKRMVKDYFDSLSPKEKRAFVNMKDAYFEEPEYDTE